MKCIKCNSDNVVEAEEKELQELNDDLSNNDLIFEYITADSKKDLFEKLEYYWESKDKRHLTKHSTYEMCCNQEVIDKLDKNKEFWNEQISFFEAIKKNDDGEKCCICKNNSDKLFYWMYEFYYWDNPKDYMLMRKCKFKTVCAIICKDCFIGG